MIHRFGHDGFAGERGSVLIIALAFTLIVGLLAAAAVATSMVQSRSSQHELDRTGALAIAEGVTETVQKKMLSEVANFQAPTLVGNVTIGGAPYPYSAVPIGPQVTRYDIDGISMQVQPFEITATLAEGSGFVTVSRVVDLTMTPLFQYMLFFEGDLEILPGPSMILEGRVHSNGSIYVGCGNTLTVNTDYFRCTGDILRKRKNDGAPTGGTVSIKVFEQAAFQNMDPDMDSDNPDWLTLSIDTWQGTVQSGAHGVTEVIAPEIGSIKAFDPVTGERGYYHENASMVIRDSQAFDSAGVPIPLPPNTITEATMYDAREGTNVTVTEIDIGLLNGSGNFPANGLIYAYRTDATPAQPNGIRLANGAELLAPLTVVTEDPIYIHGDYNSLNKKGSAVLADAVNLLSNAWDDSKTAGSLPVATNTEYNVAVVTGSVPTPDGGGNYSGGFENLPRFHERWTGKTARIRGAFVSIYDSEIAASPWSYGGDVYTAPIRDWRYDPALQDIAGLPPFTPSAVYFRRVLWDDGVPVPFAP